MSKLMSPDELASVAVLARDATAAQRNIGVTVYPGDAVRDEVLALAAGARGDALIAVLDHLELITAERDQYRRDFLTMSDFAARLTMRLKMQGCSDADIEAAKIVPPIEVPEAPRHLRRLLGSEEDLARTDERIVQWMAKHHEDAAVAADIEAAVSRALELEGQLRALAMLALEMVGTQ